MIWKQKVDLTFINQISKNTLVEHLGIEFTEVGDDYLIAKMPVDHRTHQPAGLLHGGASVALAETVGSTASFLCIETLQTKMAVGVDINASHLRGITEGYVYGKATPIRIGKSIHVWKIEVTSQSGKLICVSRLTMAIIDRR